MRGFTIVEVLVAVIILTFAGWGILQSQSQSSFMMRSNHIAWQMQLSSMPFLVTGNENLHGKEMTLYEFLSPRYNITHDEVVTALKAQKYSYSQKEFTYISLDGYMDETPDPTQTQVNSADIAQATQGVGLSIEQIVVKSPTSQSGLFTFKVTQ
ncbi:MAG: hypothetical protein KU37_04070 [Sulfuricurvum sp. PC08-66]|nr:MAG: hypothetical protein KU37_04070 [Sulfuricurvum sp. PC08-66]